MTEHVSRWSRRIVVAMLSVVVAAGSAGSHVLAQQAPTTAVVVIEPIGADGLAGLALLMPGADGGTSVQIIVSDAPSGTFAVVHGGTCDAIDPTPVALLGDVSATSQVAVPTGFGTLADGAHVLALHAGLDLTTANGCGAIPHVAGAAPSVTSSVAPAPSAVPGGGSYTAPTLGFSLTWDGRWSEFPVGGLDGHDPIGLSDGASRVVVSGVHDPDWNALACAMDSEAAFVVRESAGTYVDLEPLTEADGSRVRGGDEVRAWVGYRYTDTESGGTVAEYHECRAAHGVVVRIQHRSLPDLYEQEAVVRDRLLENLVMPSEPPATPPPAANPDCEGYPAWHAATLARVDALAALKAATDDAAMAYDQPRYVAALVRAARDGERMRGEQEREPVPPAAQEANALAATTFESFASAARLFAEYYQTNTTTATLQQAARAQRAAERVEAEFNVALADVEAACG